jgi:histidinol-phosphate aminotransferase
VLHIYPDPSQTFLRRSICSFLGGGLTPEHVCCGTGSDDNIDLVLRVVDPAVLVNLPPTFGMYPFLAKINKVRVVTVDRGAPPHFPLDYAAIGAAVAGAAGGRAVVMVASPNNPTGGMLTHAQVRALCALEAVVVLDEAYVEYAAVASMSARAPGLERLLVVRTLSKAWGLAGLRLGYATGSSALIEQVEKTRGPYKVGGLAEACALAVLQSDVAWVNEGIATVKENRAAFLRALVEKGFAPLSSEANFVLVPVSRPAGEVADRMRTHGVSVRAFPSLPGVGESVRISIGPAAVMQTCLNALVEATR